VGSVETVNIALARSESVAEPRGCVGCLEGDTRGESVADGGLVADTPADTGAVEKRDTVTDSLVDANALGNARTVAYRDPEPDSHAKHTDNVPFGVPERD